MLVPREFVSLSLRLRKVLFSEARFCRDWPLLRTQIDGARGGSVTQAGVWPSVAFVTIWRLASPMPTVPLRVLETFFPPTHEVAVGSSVR